MQSRKAARRKAKIRLGLAAVAGGGKTLSSLLIAKGMTGDLAKVGVIDSENFSADLYAHLGDFNVISLEPPFSPERYIQAIKAFESEGVEVIIIDSITHEWDGEGGVLSECDRIGGGFNSAWKIMTPRHEAFKNAILQSTCHIITTVRRKQDYILVEEANKQGKMVQKPVKAGMKEITREGWEYELTVNLEMDINHYASASKDRTGLFMGKPSFIPNEQTGEMLLEWCESGIDPAEEIKKAINALANCNTVDDLTLLKETLAAYIIADKEFKSEAMARYKKLKPVTETTTAQQQTA